MKARKPTAWNIHVKKTMKENKGMKFSDVLKQAKKLIKKNKIGG